MQVAAPGMIDVHTSRPVASETCTLGGHGAGWQLAPVFRTTTEKVTGLPAW
jgi:hypothetical protein